MQSHWAQTAWQDLKITISRFNSTGICLSGAGGHGAGSSALRRSGGAHPSRRRAPKNRSSATRFLPCAWVSKATRLTSAARCKDAGAELPEQVVAVRLRLSPSTSREGVGAFRRPAKSPAVNSPDRPKRGEFVKCALKIGGGKASKSVPHAPIGGMPPRNWALISPTLRTCSSRPCGFRRC